VGHGKCIDVRSVRQEPEEAPKVQRVNKSSDGAGPLTLNPKQEQRRSRALNPKP
jgi:hypothetical protein